MKTVSSIRSRHMPSGKIFYCKRRPRCDACYTYTDDPLMLPAIFFASRGRLIPISAGKPQRSMEKPPYNASLIKMRRLMGLHSDLAGSSCEDYSTSPGPVAITVLHRSFEARLRVATI